MVDLSSIDQEHVLTPPQLEALGHHLVHEAADMLARLLVDCPPHPLLGQQHEAAIGRWLGAWLRDVPVLEWPDDLPRLRPPREAPGISPDVLWSLRADPNGHGAAPCAYLVGTVTPMGRGCWLPAYASWFTHTPEDAAEKYCGRHQPVCPDVCPVCEVDLAAADRPLSHTNPGGVLCAFYWTPSEN